MALSLLGAIYNLVAEPAVLWLAGLLAFALVAGVMPAAIRAWRALGRTDREVSLRKVHVGEIPRVGGFVLMVGFGLVMLLGLAGTTELSATHELFSRTPLTGVLVGALVCGLTGLYDDLVGLRARHKLLLQLFAAGLAVSFGLEWPALAELLGDATWATWLTRGATLFFLVAAVNAINLMDGLDGLAGGISAIALGVVLASAVHHGAPELALGWLAAAALGAVLGFLAHNRHPARVFMGDAGAYFLGFLVAGLLLFVHPLRDRVPIITLSIPLMVLALPLFDMGLAIVRRAIRGQPIFSGDCDHIHHRLLARGLSHRRVVLFLWLSAGLYALLAYLNVIGVGGWWTLGGTVLATLVVAVILGYHNLLRRLPAFTGEGLLGVRDRRRQVMEILAAIDSLEGEGAGDRDVERWRRLGGPITPILARLGVPGFEVRREGSTLVRGGSDDGAWGWLSLPLPGSGGAELRLALAARLPDLQQEQLMLIERVVALLAGTALAARHHGGEGRPTPQPPA
ncbi:MAG: undecaprenyl/decaprenyl-phosphate alpha-N-acetylglucosaminyl 1-phosphate transferase [Myxococcales bacterium]|nr:undecaprenyl/decaprenyl-phosphate alpha-N-acetylglucosaminyl 1-phosphate transferase [Myxococcales bacterium]